MALDAQELVAEALADVEQVLGGIGREPILTLARVLAERETMTGADLAAEARRLGVGELFSRRAARSSSA